MSLHHMPKTRFPAKQHANFVALWSLWLTLLFVTQSAFAQSADAPLVLKERIEVYANVVTLGDLFENAKAQAHIPVFQSPELGKEGLVNTARIAAAAKYHGLIWNNPGGIDKVVVRRPSRNISLEEIKSLVRDAIISDVGAEEGGKLEVIFTRGMKPVHVNPKNQEPLLVKHLNYNAPTGRFRAVLGFDSIKYNARDVVIRGRATETIQVAALAFPVKRGYIIKPQDITTLSIPKKNLRRGFIKDKEDLIGKMAKRKLSPNLPIRSVDLEIPKMIHRNSLVNIIFEKGGLMLKAEGRALNNAAKGEIVSVRNTQSKRTIEGIAIGAGLVSVSGTRPRIPVTKSRKSAGARASYVVR